MIKKKQKTQGPTFDSPKEKAANLVMWANAAGLNSGSMEWKRSVSQLRTALSLRLQSDPSDELVINATEWAVQEFANYLASWVDSGLSGRVWGERNPNLLSSLSDVRATERKIELTDTGIHFELNYRPKHQRSYVRSFVEGYFLDFASTVPRPPEVRKCPGCGRFLLPVTRRQTYCSKPCKDRANVSAARPIRREKERHLKLEASTNSLKKLLSEHSKQDLADEDSTAYWMELMSKQKHNRKAFTRTWITRLTRARSRCAECRKHEQAFQKLVQSITKRVNA